MWTPTILLVWGAVAAARDPAGAAPPSARGALLRIEPDGSAWTDLCGPDLEGVEVRVMRQLSLWSEGAQQTLRDEVEVGRARLDLVDCPLARVTLFVGGEPLDLQDIVEIVPQVPRALVEVSGPSHLTRGDTGWFYLSWWGAAGGDQAPVLMWRGVTDGVAEDGWDAVEMHLIGADLYRAQVRAGSSAGEQLEWWISVPGSGAPLDGRGLSASNLGVTQVTTAQAPLWTMKAQRSEARLNIDVLQYSWDPDREVRNRDRSAVVSGHMGVRLVTQMPVWVRVGAEVIEGRDARPPAPDPPGEGSENVIAVDTTYGLMEVEVEPVEIFSFAVRGTVGTSVGITCPNDNATCPQEVDAVLGPGLQGRLRLGDRSLSNLTVTAGMRSFREPGSGAALTWEKRLFELALALDSALAGGASFGGGAGLITLPCQLSDSQPMSCRDGSDAYRKLNSYGSVELPFLSYFRIGLRAGVAAESIRAWGPSVGTTMEVAW